MSKARDLANAGTALTSVSATELGYVDGVTSAIQTQIDAKEATLPSQTGNSGKYLTTNGTAKSWGTVSQYALPSQTGNSGKFLTTNGTSESWGTVTQPITWTLRGGTTDSVNSIAYNGSNLYVAGGNAGLLLTSPDAITWTVRTSGFGAQDIRKVVYGNGIWVAVGTAGTITTSTDGTTWTARTSNFSTNDFSSIIYANSLFVAVGGGGGSTNTGGIVYSTDGITWTRKSQTPTIGSTYNDVIWNGTNWIVSADISTNNYLYATTPSGTWTAAVASSATAISKLFWDGTRTIFYNNGWYYTTSTTLASSVAYLSMGSYNSSALITTSYYYDGKVYIVPDMWYTYFTPASTSTIALSPLTYGPQATPSSSSPFVSGGSTTIFVGAIGQIIFGNRKIYTSF